MTATYTFDIFSSLDGHGSVSYARMLASGTDESEVPLRSHGSLSMNRALLAPAWSTASVEAYRYQAEQPLGKVVIAHP